MLLASLALTAALALFANRVCGQVQCSTAIETFTRPYGTLAADADDGQPILPNIYDPQAVKRPKRLPWLQGCKCCKKSIWVFGYVNPCRPSL